MAATVPPALPPIRLGMVGGGEGAFIGAVHRMENPGKVPMVLIEVQTGAYVGEDDIVRLKDLYGRCPD